MSIPPRSLSKWGRVFYGVSALAFGVQNFLFGDFVAGRAPAWPRDVAGQLVWAGVTGLVFIGSGVAIIASRRTRDASLLIGTLVMTWAFLRRLPLLIADPGTLMLTSAGKALALSGGAFAIAGTSSPSISLAPSAGRGLIALGRIGLGAFMIIGGTQHFLYAPFVALLIPVWIPARVAWTYFAGAALIAGGVGLFINPILRLAATLSGLMIGSWVFALHLPRALSAVGDAAMRNEWTALFEAVAFAGTAFVLGGIEPEMAVAPVVH